MRSKIKVKKRNLIIKGKCTKDNEEIIEIQEFPGSKSQEKAKKKNDFEISSSEATTPNKKDTKKKKGEVSIEIKDIEISLKKNEAIFNNAKSPIKESISPSRLKKSVTKLTMNNKEKKKDKKSVNPNNKTKTREKSLNVNVKRNKNVEDIMLDESDNDNQVEKNLNKREIKNASNYIKKSYKTRYRKRINKNRVTSKNKKTRNKQTQKKKIIHSPTSEEKKEKKKGLKMKIQKEKNKKKNASKNSLDNNYSDISDFSRTSKKGLKCFDMNDDEPRSQINLINALIDMDIREKMYNLLGKKRKPDNRAQKSTTPNKKKISSEISYFPPQFNSYMKKSKTPCRNPKKKNISNLHIPKVNFGLKNSEKKNKARELTTLNKLIKENGFEKVLNTLCKSKLDEKNKYESNLKNIKNSCSQSQLHLLLFNALFSYFESKFEEIQNSNKKEDSAIDIKNYLNNLSNKKSKSTNNIIELNSIYSMIDENDEIASVQTNEEKIKRISKINKKSISFEDEKKGKTPLKRGEKKADKKKISIGSHYNKDEKGNIYKYRIIYLDGKSTAIFKCYDDKCCGLGIFKLESKRFIVINGHNLSNKGHNYIKNYEKNGEEIIKKLIDSKNCDAQIYKQNEEKNVSYY